MKISIELGKDTATRDLAGLHAKLSGPEQLGMMRVIGRRADLELRAWFSHLDATKPNKKGWPRQHFWSRIRKATAFDDSKTTQTTATVTVADPAFGAKLQGATIKATGNPAKLLAIPMQAAVYGARPRSAPVAGLFFIRAQGKPGGYLVAREGQSLNFYYRLLPQVTVPKDPNALPPQDKLGAALAEEAGRFLRRHDGGAD